jgi:hypothetical protein
MHFENVSDISKTTAVSIRNAYAPSGLIFNAKSFTQGVTLC